MGSGRCICELGGPGSGYDGPHGMFCRNDMSKIENVRRVVRETIGEIPQVTLEQTEGITIEQQIRFEILRYVTKNSPKDNSSLGISSSQLKYQASILYDWVMENR